MNRIAALLALLLPAVVVVLCSGPVRAADHINFGLDWKAEAEYAGFYQAAATGLYAKRGLDVTIQQGGPQVNHTQLLLAGRLDFNIASNSFTAMNFVKENIPFRAVAAIFQKDPSVLIAHPGQGNDSFGAFSPRPELFEDLFGEVEHLRLAGRIGGAHELRRKIGAQIRRRALGDAGHHGQPECNRVL